MQATRCVRAAKSVAGRLVNAQGLLTGRLPRDDHLSQLKSLKNEQLIRLAVACGTPCSGTKDVLSRGLLDSIADPRAGSKDTTTTSEMSVISIDMGIRNLAYCHIRAGHDVTLKQPQSIKLEAWQRIDVSTGAFHTLDTEDAEKAKKSSRGPETGMGKEGSAEIEKPQSPLKESFEPTMYAEKAYHLITQLLQRHRPTHILLERQRFRSGGGPAVQEWTLRVGMFEYMLYATLHTLQAQGVHGSVVIPVLPPMVNRYWMAELEKQGTVPDSKPTSAAMKKFKIDHVSRILERKHSIGRKIECSSQASALATLFLSKTKGTKRTARVPSLPKLDDVSDCLLQSLSWIAWQENRGKLRKALQQGGVDALAQSGL